MVFISYLLPQKEKPNLTFHQLHAADNDCNNMQAQHKRTKHVNAVRGVDVETCAVVVFGVFRIAIDFVHLHSDKSVLRIPTFQFIFKQIWMAAVKNVKRKFD